MPPLQDFLHTSMVFASISTKIVKKHFFEPQNRRGNIGLKYTMETLFGKLRAGEGTGVRLGVHHGDTEKFRALA